MNRIMERKMQEKHISHVICCSIGKPCICGFKEMLQEYKEQIKRKEGRAKKGGRK